MHLDDAIADGVGGKPLEIDRDRRQRRHVAGDEIEIMARRQGLGRARPAELYAVADRRLHRPAGGGSVITLVIGVEREIDIDAAFVLVPDGVGAH